MAQDGPQCQGRHMNDDTSDALPTSNDALEDDSAAVGAAASDPGVAVATAAMSAPTAAAFVAPDFDEEASALEVTGIDMLDDVELDVKVELGRAEMYIEDVLKLAPGSVVQLDKVAGDSVDVYVNDRLVARGEVLVLNENFCVRISDIVSPVGDGDAGK